MNNFPNETASWPEEVPLLLGLYGEILVVDRWFGKDGDGRAV
jgi:hypothetical protein